MPVKIENIHTDFINCRLKSYGNQTTTREFLPGWENSTWMSLPSSPSTLQIHLSRTHTANAPNTIGSLQRSKCLTLKKSLRKWTPESVRGRMAILAALEKHFQSRAAHSECSWLYTVWISFQQWKKIQRKVTTLSALSHTHYNFRVFFTIVVLQHIQFILIYSIIYRKDKFLFSLNFKKQKQKNPGCIGKTCNQITRS